MNMNEMPKEYLKYENQEDAHCLILIRIIKQYTSNQDYVKSAVRQT